MASKEQFHSRTKGSLMENEDWWYLIADDQGEQSVLHEWSHMNPYKFGNENSGSQSYSIQDFLAGDHNDTAKSKLKILIDNA